MKLILQFAGILIAFLLLSECRGRLLTEKSTERSAVDSLAYIKGLELYLDTVTVPGDSLEYEFTLQVDPTSGTLKPVEVSTRSGRVNFSAIVDSLNRIKIRMDCLEYRKQVQLYKTLAASWRMVANNAQSSMSKEIPVYRLPYWARFLLIFQGVVIVALIFKRFFQNLFKWKP